MKRIENEKQRKEIETEEKVSEERTEKIEIEENVSDRNKFEWSMFSVIIEGTRSIHELVGIKTEVDI